MYNTALKMEPVDTGNMIKYQFDETPGYADKNVVLLVKETEVSFRGVTRKFKAIYDTTDDEMKLLAMTNDGFYQLLTTSNGNEVTLYDENGKELSSAYLVDKGSLYELRFKFPEGGIYDNAVFTMDVTQPGFVVLARDHGNEYLALSESFTMSFIEKSMTLFNWLFTGGMSS